MIGRRHPYYPYLEAALEAASLARGIHLYYLEKGFTEGTKSGPTDLVTQADREAEEAVKKIFLITGDALAQQLSRDRFFL